MVLRCGDAVRRQVSEIPYKPKALNPLNPKPYDPKAKNRSASTLNVKPLNPTT